MSNIKPVLTRQNLCDEAKLFASIESSVYESQLFGVSDGKAIGTYFEQKFRTYLSAQYEFEQCNSAKGIDFPSINVDMGWGTHCSSLFMTKLTTKYPKLLACKCCIQYLSKRHAQPTTRLRPVCSSY